jgi:molecular chaperone GrpE
MSDNTVAPPEGADQSQELEEPAGAPPGAGPGQPVPGDQQASSEEAAPEGAVSEEERLRQERDEYLDSLRRVQADFENYKKRMIRQQTEHLERAAEALVVKLLPVLDTLDLAVAHAAGREDEEAKALRQVASQLYDVLGKEGLERIEPEGAPFDPSTHDAVLHEEGPQGPHVSEVLRPGFKWRGKVIRPAMVKVQG